jgi:D-glycero-D-manno-heptose 1,7-bisphosphate phosphatase
LSRAPRTEAARLGTAFVDRDGTINEKAPEGEYITAADAFVFLPGAVEGLRLLTDLGFRTIVVTNQRGIALGRMTERDLVGIHRFMLDELRSAGANVDAIYHCPHEIGACRCRKPDVGLFLRAREEHPAISWDRCVMIGDSRSDMEAAGRLDLWRVLVTSPGSPVLLEVDVHFRAGSLSEAATWAAHAIEPSITTGAERS